MTQLMQVDNRPLNLTINQRNLYMYFLNHRKKQPHVPCYVPKVSLQSTRLEDYIRALEKLERLNVIKLERTSVNYTGWIMLEP